MNIFIIIGTLLKQCINFIVGEIADYYEIDLGL